MDPDRYGNSTKGDTGPELAEDAIWVLSSTIIIFTMQSGFGLLESGMVGRKDEVNIMMKNAIDVVAGGLSYWLFGYAFSFGKTGGYTNGFSGWGDFLLIRSEDVDDGSMYGHFFFQSSFATTATTIVSGAMAERVKLQAYTIFSFLNTIVYCFPAHWVFSENGWLRKLGMVDIAGCGPVHLLGGVTGTIAAMMLKPRIGRFDKVAKPTYLANPANALLGMFMLWSLVNHGLSLLNTLTVFWGIHRSLQKLMWGWFGFNCGSTLGVSDWKWQSAARSAVSTMNAATGGGLVAMVVSYFALDKKIDVSYFISGVLGSLVSITAFCALAEPWEGFVIGVVGAALTLAGNELLERLGIDDPVGCVGVHAFAGVWGLLAVGLFLRNNPRQRQLGIDHITVGLFYGGSVYMLCIQLLGIVSIMAWTVVTSYFFLKAIDLTLGLRISVEDELLGADIVMHGLTDMSRDSRHKLNGSVVTMGTPDDEDATEFVAGMGSPDATRHNRKRRSSTYIHLRSGINLAFRPEEDDQTATERRRRSRPMPGTMTVKLTLRSCSTNDGVIKGPDEGTVSGLTTYL